MVRLGAHGFSDMVRDILENALLTKMKPSPAKKKKLPIGKARKKAMKQLR
jgi:hypothetical protein